MIIKRTFFILNGIFFLIIFERSTVFIYDFLFCDFIKQILILKL